METVKIAGQNFEPGSGGIWEEGRGRGEEKRKSEENLREWDGERTDMTARKEISD